MIHEEKTQTTCVLRLFGAPLWAVQQAVQQTGLAAQCRSRGAETLAALQTETPTALSKARKALADRFAAELYGEGEMTLVHAAVQALETHHRLLVCCDADAGTLLEARMETVAGAEKVFDFGAMSYADAKVREKLSAKVCRVKGGPVPAKLTRVRAAQRLVGADFAAGCLERAEDTVLFLGSRKGCWVRTVANADTPALWLLDMIRRAASGLPQAAGTIWQKYGRAIPADALTAQRLPDKPEPDAPTAAPRKRHRVRNALIFLLILALAAFAAAWYYTGGDLAALPQLGKPRQYPIEPLAGHVDISVHIGRTVYAFSSRYFQSLKSALEPCPAILLFLYESHRLFGGLYLLGEFCDDLFCCFGSLVIRVFVREHF